MLIAAIATGSPGRGGHAAETVPYAVTVEATGDSALDEVVRQTSSLMTLREKAPVGPLGLVLRARDDIDRVTTALNAQGYYAGVVTVTVAGRGLDDQTLPEVLEALPAEQVAPVAIAIRPGPVFKLRRITFTGEVSPAAREALGLHPGQPALAAEVLAARDRLRAALLAEGHALVRVAEPDARLDPATEALDVAFTVEPGPVVALGPITFAGLERVTERFARGRLGLSPGERYDPARLDLARRDLSAADVFGSVLIEPADTTDASGQLPLTITVKERPRHVVNFGAAFATDQGGSLSASWEDRNVFGNAEKLVLSAGLTQLGGTASRQPGYNIGTALTFPDWHRRDQKLTINATALREYLQAYDRTGVVLGAAVSRLLDTHLTASAGVTWTAEQITQEAITRDYLLLQLPLRLTYDSTDSVFEPRRGLRGSISVTPTQSLGKAGNASFLIGYASGSAYADIRGDGRTILAARALVGAITGGTTFAVPPDQRFYGGGSATVRGFRYQSIGPQFPSGRPTGGTAMDAATVEYRQRIMADWGAAIFVDAGQVSAKGVPLDGSVHVGVGAGVRYYSSIGPIRLDLALPVTRDRKGDTFELYIGIGEAF